MSRVLAIASGKGGAGKTSLAVNLAFALGWLGRRVCLLDADLGLSNVDILLGLSPALTLEQVLFEGASMEEAVMSVGPLVDVVSGSSGVARMAELTRPARARLAKEFAKLTAYDYILVDNSPGITRQVVSLCLGCDEIMVVVNPEPASITDAYALVKVLRENGLCKSPGLLFNRVRGETQATEVFARFKAACAKHLRLSCSYLGFVPFDQAMGAAAARQRPLLETNPASPASRALLKLAQTLERQNLRQGLEGQAEQFFERSMVRLLERPAPARAPAKAPDALLGHLDQAMVLVSGLAQSLPPKAFAERLAGLGRELALARELLGAGTAAAKPGPATVGQTPKVALFSSDQDLGEVLEEALRLSGMAVSRLKAGESMDAQVMVVATGGDERTLVHLLDNRPGDMPLVLVDATGRGAPQGLAGTAGTVLHHPLRLDELIAAVKRCCPRQPWTAPVRGE